MEDERGHMTRMMSRAWLVLVLLIAALALVSALAGCEDDGEATANTETKTETESTDTTTSTSQTTQTSETTMVSGGKSLDEYRAEIPELQKAVEADPQDLTSWERLAVAHYQLKEYDKAEEAYLKILAVVDDAFTHNNLGNVYRDQQLYDKAIAQYETAIELDKTLKQPYINLAGVYKKMGDMEKAVAILEQAKTALTGEDAKTVEEYQEQLTSTTTSKTTATSTTTSASSK